MHACQAGPFRCVGIYLLFLGNLTSSRGRSSTTRLSVRSDCRCVELATASSTCRCLHPRAPFNKSRQQQPPGESIDGRLTSSTLGPQYLRESGTQQHHHPTSTVTCKYYHHDEELSTVGQPKAHQRSFCAHAWKGWRVSTKVTSPLGRRGSTAKRQQTWSTARHGQRRVPNSICLVSSTTLPPLIHRRQQPITH